MNPDSGERRIGPVRGGWGVVLMIMLAVIMSSCGVKNAPLPRRELLPDRPRMASYEFDEDGLLVITFRPPVNQVNNLPLKDLAGFTVERSETWGGPEFCSSCPPEFTKDFRIPAVPPPPRQTVADAPYRFEDRLRPGYIYYYRIRGVDSAGRSDPLRFLMQVIHYDSPGRPPESLKVDDREGFPVLSWPPTTQLVDGRPASGIAGYNVYRRQAGGEWSLLTPPDQPWPNTTFKDTLAQVGTNYEYKVRAVRIVRETRIPGPASPAAALTTADLTPPPPPVKVIAASLKAGVNLNWPAVSASDLAGYRVYRRQAGEPAFRRIGPDMIANNQFLDTTAKAGEAYVYRVTSVDKSKKPNESRPCPEVEFRFEP